MDVVRDDANLPRQLRLSTTIRKPQQPQRTPPAHTASSCLVTIVPPLLIKLNPNPNPEPSSIQRLLRLRIILTAHRHPPIVLRRPIKLRRKRLGVLRRKRPIDRPRKLLVLINVNHIIRRRRLGSPILIERLLVFICRSRRLRLDPRPSSRSSATSPSSPSASSSSSSTKSNSSSYKSSSSSAAMPHILPKKCLKVTFRVSMTPQTSST